MTLKPEHRELFAGANYAVATTLRPDGSPHSTVVWVDLEEDGTPSFNTTTSRVKNDNLRNDPRISLLVFKGDDFHTWVAVDGRVELTDDGAEEQIDTLSRRYYGKPWTYRDGEERVKARVLPERVSDYGLT